MKRFLSIVVLFMATGFLMAAGAAPTLKVAALHPFLGEMATRIGGEHVEVVNLLKANGNLHAFEPTPDMIAQAAGSRFILASGKNLEPYLKGLGDSVSSPTQGTTEIIDMGANIPDVAAADGEQSEHEHADGTTCNHAHGPNDPHWWHTPANMKRAARAISTLFSQTDPTHAADYKKALTKWNKEMDALNSWARVELADIPDAHRLLVTGHSAMGHFCKEYGFTELPIQGISREDEGNPARLGKILQDLRNRQARAIFPEYGSSPKALHNIAQTLHIPLASPLVTDGLAPETPTFESMFKKNVSSIKQALLAH